MKIDWDVAIKIIVPLGTLILGKYLDRWFSKRPKLISYLGHASAFNVRGAAPFTVHTHAIVVRNAGRATANHLRIGHNILPDNIQLYPPVSHTIDRPEGGGADIIIPTLVPGEQVTISYLYLPPVLWNQINTYIKSDEGLAKNITVLPAPQISKFLLFILKGLVYVGAVTIIYLLVALIKYLF